MTDQTPVTNVSVAEMLASVFNGKDKNFRDTVLGSEDLMSDLKGAVTTGNTIVDIHLGGGIFPGRIYEVFGEEGAGKTTLLHMIEAWWQAQSPLHLVHRIETESALDKERAQSIGVDMTRVILSETDVVEDGFDLIHNVTEKMIATFGPEVRVLHLWDTLAAASTRNEKNGDQYGGGMMEKPRVIKAALRDLTGRLAEWKSPFFIINQVMDADNWIGVSTPGGRGIRHHASARIFVKKKGFLFKPGTELRIGNHVQFVLIKNKVSMPDLSFDLKLHYETGFREDETLIDYVAQNKDYTEEGIRTGGWYGLKLPVLFHEYCSNPDMSLRLAELEKYVAESRFFHKYMQYLAYLAYVNKYPLMKLKYRHMMWVKMIELIKIWNKGKRIPGYRDIKPIPQEQWPVEPEEPTQDEFREINGQIALMNERLADLEGPDFEDE